MLASKVNDDKKITLKNQTVFGAKLNLLVASENDTLSTALALSLKKRRVKVNLYFSPLEKVKKQLPVILIKIVRGDEQIAFHSGVSHGGAKIRISEVDEQTINSIKCLAKTYACEDFVTEIIDEGKTLTSVTCYYSEERFEQYLMEQARLLVNARVETLSAYPPFAVDTDAQTILHRSLRLQRVKVIDEMTFVDDFCERDKREDRILFMEIRAEQNANEVAEAVADALKKLTEAI